MTEKVVEEAPKGENKELDIYEMKQDTLIWKEK